MSAYRGEARPIALAFRDFRPRLLDAGGIVTPPTFEPFEAVLAEANAWLEKTGVTVLNVETLLLPNLTLLTEKTTSQTSALTAVEGTTYWHQVLRVWYGS